MEDNHWVDRLGDDSASCLRELSVELGQLKEDCIESATRLPRLDDGGITFREACSAKRLTQVLRDRERSHQKIQTTLHSPICAAREDLKSFPKSDPAPGKLGQRVKKLLPLPEAEAVH